MDDDETDMDHLSKSFFVTSAICFFLIGIIATIGNLLTVIALATSSTRRSATTLLVINLSVSILPICVLTMPFLTSLSLEKVVSEHRTITPKTMKAFYILTCICNQVELHTIVGLAFNRACAVTSPAFYKQYLNKPIIIWSSLTVIWIYSVALWIPVSIGIWGELKVHKARYFIEVKDDDSDATTAVLIFFTYILPFLIAVGCHIVMFYKFRTSRFQTSATMIRPWQNHVTRTMTIIFLLQFIFSVPHFVAHILKRRGSWARTWMYIHVFYFSRFCINPLVYIFSSHRYKKDCTRVIRKLFCLQPQKKTIESLNQEEQNLNTIDRFQGHQSSKEETIDVL